MDDSIEIQEVNLQLRAIESEAIRDPIPPERMDEFINLIRTVVSSIFSEKKLPSGLDFDDLVGYGYEGLVKAWRNFKSDKGAIFKTYATYRIRGEILDYLRREWRTRNPAYKRKIENEKIQEKIMYLAKDTFDGLITASDDEKDLVLQSVISNSAIIYMLSLESMENIPNSLRKEDISSEIINRIERTNERIFLQDSIEKLTLEEKILVKMYYYEGKSQVDISIALNVSKSKVCRMHVLTLTKLKKKLAQKIKSEWSV